VYTPKTVESEQIFWGYAAPVQATVLLVSVDAALHTGLQEALELCGYQVVTARTAQEAEEAKQSFDCEALGLIIVGAQRAGKHRILQYDGLYRCWQAVYPNLPLLLLDDACSSKAFPAFCGDNVHVLTNPFAEEELFNIVWKLLRHKKHRKYLPSVSYEPNRLRSVAY
jgi:DNA-binding NtrC family response regulator